MIVHLKSILGELFTGAAAVLAFGLVKAAARGTGAGTTKAKSLEARIEDLEHRLGVQEDMEEIRRLHYIYGYYMDKFMYNEVVEMFSDNAESAEVVGRGIYLGKRGVETLFKKVFGGMYGEGKMGPVFGSMIDHLMMQGVIHVAPDRLTAKARFRLLTQWGNWEQKTAFWRGGLYENEYVKENGRWMIKKLRYITSWSCPFEESWAKAEPYHPMPSKEFPPDLPSPSFHIFPDNVIVPFHYPHPVTGKWTEE